MAMKKGKIEEIKKNFTLPDGIKISIDGYALVKIPLREGKFVNHIRLWMNKYGMNGHSA